MNKYIYQKFLLNCDYEGVKIEDFPVFKGDIDNVLDYQCEYCLLDVGKEVVRKINVVDIDEQVDTKEDWEQFIYELDGVDTIILYNFKVNSTNPIINSYREATLKAYLYRLQDKECKICLL